MDEYLAMVKMFAGNFAPKYYMFCSGQVLSISQNTALFSLLGTTYGGDGQTTFCLPDLRGRAPIGPGQGPGLGNYNLGQKGGTESVTLIANQMPAHAHVFSASTNAGTGNTPGGSSLLGAPPGIGTGPTAQPVNIYTGDSGGTAMSPTSIAPAGGSQPHENMQPYSAINFVITVAGIFPSRD